MDLRSRLRALIARSPTAVNIGTLLSGTVLAQVVMLATTPVVSRLYTPAELGSFAALMAIPQTVAVVAGLRYDMAVVLPERDQDARRLVRIVLVVATLTSVLTSLVTVLGATRIAGWMHHPELAGWMAWTGVIVWATALVNLMGYWFTRRTRYGAISTNRIQQSASVEGLRIVSAWAGHGGIAGQLLGQVAGQVVAALTLLWRGRNAWSGDLQGAAPARDLLRRHRRMPLLNAPNALVDAVRTNGIVLLVGIHFTAALQGQFAKAWLLMQAPLVLVNGAVSQVFFQRFATTPRGGMETLVRRSVRLSLLAGLLPFALLALVAPALFPWYLGAEWGESGLIARTLVPWLYLNLVTAPISTVFVVTDNQALMLAFAVVYAGVPLAIIAWAASAGWGLVATMWGVSGAMAALLAGLVGLTLWVARRWDAQEAP